MAHPPPIAGELVVVALKAEQLQHQAPAKQDPFCLFRVGNVVKRTKVDHGGGLYPIWDDQVNIPVAAGIHQMHVQIFDKDTKPNNLMGEGVIDLTRVLREKEHDGYFPLQYKGRPNCGDIYLELTFYLAHTAARPQQQVRYQYPAGHVPGGTYQQRTQHSPYPSQPPQPQQSHYSPQPQQPQYTQQYTPQHRPVPQQHRPLPSPMQQRPPPIQIQQHRPHPPQQHRPMGQQRPMHPLPVAPQQHSPYPQPRPSSSMGTQQFSPAMPSPQPLLSAAYNPGLSPGMRPTNVPYPNYQSGPPPAGFHENQRPPMNYPMRPPPPSNGYNQRPYPPY